MSPRHDRAVAADTAADAAAAVDDQRGAPISSFSRCEESNEVLIVVGR